jgi:hypothetical protein
VESQRASEPRADTTRHATLDESRAIARQEVALDSFEIFELLVVESRTLATNLGDVIRQGPSL